MFKLETIQELSCLNDFDIYVELILINLFLFFVVVVVAVEMVYISVNCFSVFIKSYNVSLNL